jgi:uroporphyrinogen-III decarboxylase
MEKGIPGPFSGIMERALAYHERFRERAAKETFLGRPIRAVPPGCGGGTDGPMTVACNLFGAEFVCTAMAGEPERLARLLEFITEANLRRMAAWKKLAGVVVPQESFWFADDSVALISTAMYREHVLPWQRRLCETFAGKRRAIHLCGDATRHFPFLVRELGISGFDTGFPVDFGRLRRELGPEVALQGGPHIEFLRRATPREVFDETRRILGTGVLEGGRFLLREGNNLAPRTPPENLAAMYRAGREFGWKA